MFGIIYLCTNLVNGKRYVGQTTQKFSVRIDQHTKYKIDDGKYFHNALKHYGLDNFKWEIIDEADNIDELNQKEVYWVNHYNTFVDWENSWGYNHTIGGNQYIFSKERNDKIGKSRMGKLHTEDAKKSISKSRVGKYLGESCATSKLTDELVYEIKEKLANGKSCLELSKNYNVGEATIQDIKACRTWKQIHSDVNNLLVDMLWQNKNKDRDFQIIKLINDGKTQGEISKLLNLPISTIKGVRQRYNKKEE